MVQKIQALEAALKDTKSVSIKRIAKLVIVAGNRNWMIIGFFFPGYRRTWATN